MKVVGDDPFGTAIASLSEDQLARFSAGDVRFDAPMREGDGLGPAYIHDRCAACHSNDAKGPGYATKFVLVADDGITPLVDQSALTWGHTARPHVAGGASTPLLPPDRPDVHVTRRLGPAVFGRGYLEAVSDAEIERIAVVQGVRDDGISGTVSRVPFQGEIPTEAAFFPHQPGDDGLVGRFGVKARLASIEEFVADALQGDMSITSPMRPNEVPNPDDLVDDLLPGVDLDAETVRQLAFYVRALEIPTRPDLDPEGSRLFGDIFCDRCHVPTMHTRADYPIAALADIDAPIYTDLLLHDMGDELADSLAEGGASGRQWRTAPLIGLRHLRSYLHDGRALTLRDAVEAHRGPGSEANGAVSGFESLSEEDQETLLAFLAAL